MPTRWKAPTTSVAPKASQVWRRSSWPMASTAHCIVTQRDGEADEAHVARA